MPPLPANTPHEFVVFLPLAVGSLRADATPAASPLDTARALLEHLNVGRAEVGQDVLTGGVEVRFYYDASVLSRVKTWLRQQAVPFDISVL